MYILKGWNGYDDSSETIEEDTWIHALGTIIHWLRKWPEFSVYKGKDPQPILVYRNYGSLT